MFHSQLSWIKFIVGISTHLYVPKFGRSGFKSDKERERKVTQHDKGDCGIDHIRYNAGILACHSPSSRLSNEHDLLGLLCIIVSRSLHMGEHGNRLVVLLQQHHEFPQGSWGRRSQRFAAVLEPVCITHICRLMGSTCLLRTEKISPAIRLKGFKSWKVVLWCDLNNPGRKKLVQVDILESIHDPFCNKCIA